MMWDNNGPDAVPGEVDMRVGTQTSPGGGPQKMDGNLKGANSL